MVGKRSGGAFIASMGTCEVSMTMLAPGAPGGAAPTSACPGSPGAPLCTVTPTTDPEPCACGGKQAVR